MRTALVILVLLGLGGGCVWVSDHGIYHRTDTVKQAGTNKATRIEVRP